MLAAAVTKIKQLTGDFTPQLGIYLGSGLGDFAKGMQMKAVIPYCDIPHFPVSQVAGHPGNLILGWINEYPVACFQGRWHYYEGYSSEELRLPIHCLRQLGCQRLLLTNAAASLQQEQNLGSLLLITDHINFQGRNPLVGMNTGEFGPRFPEMGEAYDRRLRQLLLAAAKQQGIVLHQGVYLAVLGPSYETPAEIRAFVRLGADAVGMSTVPEVIVARHCGMTVAAISVLTNRGCGLAPVTLRHEDVVVMGQQAAVALTRLVQAFVERLKSE